jgi:hypothetical protein
MDYVKLDYTLLYEHSKAPIKMENRRNFYVSPVWLVFIMILASFE